MNILRSGSEANLKELEKTDPSAAPLVDKRPDSDTPPTLEEWSLRVLAGVKRMHSDEAFRLEVARKLS